MPTDLTVPSQEPEDSDEHDVSLLDLVPKNFVKFIEKVPPEWLALSEHELRPIVFENIVIQKNTKSHISVVDQIRASFWLEHEVAIVQKRRMVSANIYCDIMLKGNFYTSFLPNPKKVAWMILPLGSHTADVSFMLKTGRQRMNEILNLPVERNICRCHWECVCYGKASNRKIDAAMLNPCVCSEQCICPPLVDHKTIEVQKKIYDTLELRAKGSVPQVVNQKTLSVNLHKHQNIEPETQQLPSSLEEIHSKIRELQETSETPSLPPNEEQAKILDSQALNVLEPEIVE